MPSAVNRSQYNGYSRLKQRGFFTDMLSRCLFGSGAADSASSFGLQISPAHFAERYVTSLAEQWVRQPRSTRDIAILLLVAALALMPRIRLGRWLNAGGAGCTDQRAGGVLVPKLAYYCRNTRRSNTMPQIAVAAVAPHIPASVETMPKRPSRHPIAITV